MKIKIYESKICIGCNNEFNNSSARTENEYKKQKFCGLPCFRKNNKHSRIKGPGSSSWKGGVQYHNGYRYLYAPNHPFRARELYVAEHRLVLEKHMGRYIKKGEYIHHINGNRLDNRADNLFVCTMKEHVAIHRQLDKLMGDLVSLGVLFFDAQRRQYCLTKSQK